MHIIADLRSSFGLYFSLVPSYYRKGMRGFSTSCSSTMSRSYYRSSTRQPLARPAKSMDPYLVALRVFISVWRRSKFCFMDFFFGLQNAIACSGSYGVLFGCAGERSLRCWRTGQRGAFKLLLLLMVNGFWGLEISDARYGSTLF